MLPAKYMRATSFIGDLWIPKGPLRFDNGIRAKDGAPTLILLSRGVKLNLKKADTRLI